MINSSLVRSLYNLPVAFWLGFLDSELNFHLGHFPSLSTDLDSSMALATMSLADLAPMEDTRRILDMGCGWGGPAFQLSHRWQTEVVGLTDSDVQVHFVNDKANSLKAAVSARVFDIETTDLDDLGSFDLFWLYEVLEHIRNPRSVLKALHLNSQENTFLALCVSCKAGDVQSVLLNPLLGIQPLLKEGEILEMLRGAGWETLAVKDCSALTTPTWQHWTEGLESLAFSEYSRLAEAINGEFRRISQGFAQGTLRSIQLVARRV